MLALCVFLFVVCVVLALVVRRLRIDLRRVRATNMALVRGTHGALIANNTRDLTEQLRWLRRVLVSLDDYTNLTVQLNRGSGVYETRGCVVCHGVVQPYGGCRASHRDGNLWQHDACAEKAREAAIGWAESHQAANPGHATSVVDGVARCVTCRLVLDMVGA